MARLEPAPESDAQTFSVDEALEKLPLGWTHLKVFCVCGFAWMVDGIEVLLLAFIGPSVRCEWGVSDAQAASMTTIVFAGMSIGAVCWGAIADRYGRRLSLTLSTVVILVAGMLCAFAGSFQILLLLRLIVGIGVSGAHVAFSLLVEWMPPRVRGRVGIALTTWWSLGAVAEALCARLLMPTLGWRYLLFFSAAPALLLLLAAPWMPESPRFYVAQGRLAEAEASLRRAAHQCGGTLPAGTLARGAAPLNDAGGGKLGDLFTRELRRLTASQWGLWFAAAFTYYGSVLITTELLAADSCGYRSTGDAGGGSAAGQCTLLTADDYDANIVATAGELPGIIITFFVIDRIGRRRTIGCESLVMAAAMLLVIPCLSLPFQTGALFVMRGAADGLFQAAFVYTSEVYPSSIRGLGLGWCSSFSRLGGMTTPFVAQVLTRTSPGIALGLYAAAAVCLGLIAFTLEVETLGKPMFTSVDELRVELDKVRSRRKTRGTWLELRLSTADERTGTRASKLDTRASKLDIRAGTAGKGASTSRTFGADEFDAHASWHSALSLPPTAR
ncbi:hypothetical protein KFE25_009397 [Diacronema lutheri]|uniref:Major facilitator superfamily (MFS) profile domain-containing protein n=1 Tax=Diacronema lutheri TaxID=2081491 RepID=A0A8J6CHB4_DIALT|nr:hypothetical protein KFE25_009397 [Diacronema lutheri]